MIEEIVVYIQNNSAFYLLSVKQHLQISMLSLLLAIFIGGIGGFLGYKKKIHTWLTRGVQILRIIPSLAILVLLIPIIGTGIRPTLIALIMLALPPILMNTFVALREVPEFMLETAKGMGMSEAQVMWKIQIPLALPTIFIGIKTAAVEIVASATLASKIGGGGLGDLIFTGLGLNRMDILLVGGITVTVLSLIISIGIDVLSKRLIREKRR